ncbi:Protein MSP1 [Fusarium austroafricanum]|uniref:Protein MSP1 n=1 Tax=Fusarium austroafricanum TaxID=2364996 RepID=A0A8H4KSG0_9HYPO|nr:Protein MSP1 [Fusarium austroafricanum]
MATPAAPLNNTPVPAPSCPPGEGNKRPDLLVVQEDNDSATHLGPTEQDDPASHGPGANPDEENPRDLATDARPKSHESPSDVMLEIRALQNKLLLLEGRVGNGSGIAHGDSGRSDEKRLSHITDERKLRKQIRRAQSARKWVDETESFANETRDERASHGREGMFMHYITPAGEEHVVSGRREVGKGGTNFQSEAEYDFWNVVLNEPHRGIRPPTSLRPHYSRKLGPPNEWDTSDSDEWSSGTSIATRDFDYFRARLRGDFEWELDRLNSQKSRFEKHKKKKKQIQAEKEEQARHRDDPAKAKVEEEDEEVEEDNKNHTIAVNLNPLEWRDFRASRKTVARSSSLIDILIGEPQVLDQFFDHYRTKAMKDKAISHRSKTVEGHQTQKGEATGQSSARDGRAPLPERIRIHSKELIKTLGILHGSELASEGIPTDSLVMFRPYRMLTYYETEIRQWHSRLEKKFQKSEALSAETVATEQLTTNVGGAAADDEKEDAKSIQEETSDVPDPEGYSKSETTLEHLTCLLEFMDQYILKRMKYLESSACEKIFFSDIWHLFKPGDHVISADGKQVYQVFNVISHPHVGTDRWSKFTKAMEDSSDESIDDDISIQCVFIHFDGQQIGPVLRTFSIPKFDGEKPVTSLTIYPIQFHVRKKLDRHIMKLKQSGDQVDEAVKNGVTKLQETLVERGKLFTEVAAVKHMYYSGLTVDTRDEVQSQVMIDFAEAFMVEKNKNWKPDLKQLIGFVATGDSTDPEAPCNALCCANEIAHNDVYVDKKRHHDFMKVMMSGMEDGMDDLPPANIYPRPLETLKTGESKLTRDDLLIMSYSVFGFVLRDRSWAQLDLTHLTHVTDLVDEPVTINDDDTEDDKTAFGQLVLPPGHKKMVLSLISQHFRNKAMQRERERDEQVDIVRGKGKGLIILLHGAPGVGKTTTAEGVAEKFKKPLFQITCGDLGSTAKEVEDALQTNFALANRWGCILLLDEADVFLAERRRDDFTRNGLVAVFLRVLEYYAGILFLTTNRIGDFDEAFASRVHMSLHYPPLTERSTSRIFELNLKMIKARYQSADRKIAIDKDEILEYAERYWQNNKKARLNGRQIRNACQTALALAEFDAQPEGSKYDLAVTSDAKVHLSVKNIQTVSDAYLEFIEYLKAVHGTDAETHANEAGLRALETAYLAMKSSGGLRGMSSSQAPEARENQLHKFKLQSPLPQAQTAQVRPKPDYHAQQHRRGPSYDVAHPSMGPYNTPPRMAQPPSGMTPYGQGMSMPGQNYPQYQDQVSAQEQFNPSGSQQRLSLPQHRSYSPSPPGSGPQYRPSSGTHMADGAANASMGPMHERSAEAYGRQDPRTGNVWPPNVEEQRPGNDLPQQFRDHNQSYPHAGNPI